MFHNEHLSISSPSFFRVQQSALVVGCVWSPSPFKEVKEWLQDVNLWSRGLLSAPLTFLPWSNAAIAMRARRRLANRMRVWIEACEEDDASLLAQLKFAKYDGDGGQLGSGDDNTLSEDAIIDNVLTFLFAGSDTTASALTSAFVHLSRDAALQQRVRDACRRGHEDDDRGGSQSCEALLDAVWSETLRVYPPAPFGMRLVGKEPLVVGEYMVQKANHQ